WIDGQAKPFDSESWLQKFTPRRARSVWSKVNTQKVERLIEAGRMKPAGLKQIEAAKLDGRWESAYDPQSTATVPDDFLRELEKDEKAKAFFDTLNKTNRYAIIWRLQTAKKPETRERRMKVILEMLARGEKFHS
ncbi:MAG TPA: YdeI/OmpD-associated family protein, partial [Chloroflexia bacterium]|nr:YdeI/OmpD-associated family protein [Chloroflexia bacterium]